MNVNVPVQPVLIVRICDVCGEGEMITTKIVKKPKRSKTSKKTVAGFVHKCHKCNVEEILPNEYPLLDHHRPSIEKIIELVKPKKIITLGNA